PLQVISYGFDQANHKILFRDGCPTLRLHLQKNCTICTLLAELLGACQTKKHCVLEIVSKEEKSFLQKSGDHHKIEYVPHENMTLVHSVEQFITSKSIQQ